MCSPRRAGRRPRPEMVAVRGVQAEMAHRMTLSRRQIPDAHAGVQVDCSGLLRLRDRMRDISRRRVADHAVRADPAAVDDRAAPPPEPELDVAGHHRRAADPPALRGASGVRRGGAARAAGARRQRCARQDHAGAGGRGRAADPRRARRHAQTGGTAGLHVHGVQLRRAGVGRRRAGDQLPGGGHPRDGLAEAARRSSSTARWLCGRRCH